MNEIIRYATRPSYTRFNPTTNGEIHLGHTYMILVNEAEAHANNGKFTVRFDDNQDAYLYGVSWTGKRMTPNDIDDVKKNMRETIEWLGIKVDGWSSQRENETRVDEFLSFINKGALRVRKVYTSQTNPELHWDSFDTPYPYVPWFTAEKVLYDYLDGVNCLIRGEDLLSEWSLYMYFCDLWGIPAPRQVFLRRLRLGDGSELLDISKTRGTGTISQFRALGWSAKDLIAKLAEACLIEPDKPWLISNCKVNPIWKW